MPDAGARRGPFLLAAATFAAAALADRVPPALANWLLPAFAVLLVLGPSLLYPRLRRGGTAAAAAAAGALLTPLLWMAKECVAVGRIFGPGSGLYYALNPLALGLLAAAALQMALAELVLAAGRGGARTVPGAVAVVLALAALAAAYAAVAARADPTFPFWLWVEGYRRLFGAA